MTTHTVKQLPKNTFEIEVTIPWKEIETNYAKAFEALHTQFEMKGFRKGKVPRDLAEKNIPKDAIYQQMMKTFLPDVYEEVLKKEDIKPVISPRIELKKAKENEDWVILFKVATKPTIDISKYKEVVKKAKEGAKKADIWVPGKDQKEQKPEENKQQVLNEVLEALVKEVPAEISELIIEEELNNRLSRLVDDIQKIGLTTDAYLKSKNLTMDDLKKRFTQEIEETYKIEFMLNEIADKEGIKVDQSDLDKLFSNIKDIKEQQAAQQNAYFYATILRKQKTIEFLTSL